MKTLSPQFQKERDAAEARSVALSAASAIAQMDPHGRRDLVCYLTELDEAIRAGDEESAAYLVGAISEVFHLPSDQNAPDLDEWQAEIERTPAGRRAAQKLREETDRFFARYHALKEQAGLRTIREVADAAGLSPTTVQAIEAQRVKPQTRTLQALAKAFGVPVDQLLAD